MTYPASKILSLFCALLMGAIPAHAQLDTAGLIAHWPFNGNLNDVTGKGHDAGARNANTWTAHTPAYTAGINNAGNSACVFDATYLMNGAYQPDLNQLQHFSICAVLKLDSNNGWNTILSRGGGSMQNPIWGAEVSNPISRPEMYFTPVSYYNLPYYEREDFQYYPSATTGTWYYLVITFDGTVFNTYINGMLKNQYYARNVLSFSLGSILLDIGGYWDSWFLRPQSMFKGIMDDLRLYNRALSDSEIVQYPFSFYDTTVVLNMPPGDSVLCSGILLDVKHMVSKPFRSTNVFTVQMSDTNGSFTAPIQIGRDSTNLSGTIPCIFPPATPPGRYKIRMIATAPVDTTLEFDINYHPAKELEATTLGLRHRIVSYYWPTDGICQGDSMVFTATNLMGMGETPAAYRWQKNGVDIAGAMSPTYSTKAANDQDSFRCILKSNHACWFGDSVASTYYTVHVDTIPNVFATISIVPNDSICLGDSAVVYISAKQHITTGANIWWHRLNRPGTSSYLSTTTDTISYKQIKNRDTFFCSFVSHATCAPMGRINSNYIVMHLDSNINPPKATISVQPGATVPAGTDVTFTANVSDTGDAPIYQWLKNNQPIPGATGKTFFAPYPSLTFSDEIRFFVRNTTDKCANPDTAISNGISVSYAYIDVPVLGNNNSQYYIYPNPNTGSFVLEGVVAGTETILTTLTDVTGRILYNKEITPENGRVRTGITLDNNIPSGIYLLRLSSAGETQVLRVTVSK